MVKENLSFQAEVGKLLHLVTHSLYKDKQIFLREIISNASDACDKLRYAALTDESLIEDNTDLSVQISIDQKKSQLTVEDNGIGMSKKELVDNLGTIARSGTAKFIEQLSENQDNSNLIGQFGVGFYSVFMVAKKVDVYSTKAGTKTSWMWSSAGSEKFSISSTSEGPSRGTRIVIELDDQSQEYTNVENLKPIIKKYSDHLNLPIIFNNDEENEQLNTGMALWARQKRSIKQEQYFEFYQSTFGQFDEPLHISHFQTEGQLSYIGLMYIPSTPTFDLFMPESKNKIK
ncbi:MAG: molecular chaperone HtpG, partial [Dehalococcoidaceae bacterium]|nr:molecular chaperone HtpG [Dehalococcoidaceae bacterium]